MHAPPLPQQFGLGGNILRLVPGKLTLPLVCLPWVYNGKVCHSQEGSGTGVEGKKVQPHQTFIMICSPGAGKSMQSQERMGQDWEWDCMDFPKSKGKDVLCSPGHCSGCHEDGRGCGVLLPLACCALQEAKGGEVLPWVYLGCSSSSSTFFFVPFTPEIAWTA